MKGCRGALPALPALGRSPLISLLAKYRVKANGSKVYNYHILPKTLQEYLCIYKDLEEFGCIGAGALNISEWFLAESIGPVCLDPGIYRE